MSDKPLAGHRVLVFVDDVYEDMELWYPKYRLQEAGATVVVAGPEAGKTYTGKHGYPCKADATIGEMDAATFDAVVCPGGFAPDKLRRDAKVKQLIKAIADAGKPVAAICHGGWLCISAGVYNRVRVTGSPGIKDDLVNAGAVWEDAAVVVDGQFISSRKPDDLPAFMAAVIDVMRGAAAR